MWKYFNAPSGAILAGPASLLDDLFHSRRMFGGGLPYAWPLAAAALHSIEGFEERFAAGVAAGEELKVALNGIPGLQVEEIPDGSNIFKLHVEQGDPSILRAVLQEKDVLLSGPNPNFNGFAVGVNETLTRKPVEEIARGFSEGLRR
jgi:threonine aldolase